MAGEYVDELMLKLGLDVDRQEFQKAESMFSSLRGGAMGVAGAMGVVGAGISSMVSKADKIGDLSRNADQLDTTAASIDALGYALERAGGQSENAVGTISTAQDQLDKLRVGDVSAFTDASMWGIDTAPLMEAQNAMEMLLELSDQLEDKNPQQQRNALEALGLGSQGQFGALTQGRDHLEETLERGRQMAAISDGLVDNSRQINRTLTDLDQAFEGITNELTDRYLPAIVKGADLITDLVGTEKSRENIVDVAVGGPMALMEDAGDKWLRENLGSVGRFLASDLGEYLPVISGNDEQQRIAPEAINAAVAATAGSNDVSPELLEAVMMQESRGRHRDANGNLITNPSSGARGAYQVMPHTARDPGYGVDPLRNDSREEHRRFADDYIGAMEDLFDGSTRKALAAYNAGPGAVQDAEDEYGKQWLSGLPGETQAYVPQVMERYSQQGGSTTVTNHNTFHVNGAQDPGLTADEMERRLGQIADKARQDTANPVY